MTAPDRPSIDATDRSISPIITISSIGSAMMPISPMFRPVKKSVLADRNVEDSAEPNTSTAMSTTTSATSQRIRPRQGACLPVSGPVRSVSTGGGVVRVSDIAVRSLGRLQTSGHARAQPAVEGDRGEQQRAGDGVVPERRDAAGDQRLVDRVEQQRTQCGPQHG